MSFITKKICQAAVQEILNASEAKPKKLRLKEKEGRCIVYYGDGILTYGVTWAGALQAYQSRVNQGKTINQFLNALLEMTDEDFATYLADPDTANLPEELKMAVNVEKQRRDQEKDPTPPPLLPGTMRSGYAAIQEEATT